MMRNSTMADRVLLSVIIPTFNRSADLAPVLTQIRGELAGRTDVEVIVVDNNSTDDTALMVRTRALKWPALRYVLGREQGASSARNAGYRASRGVVCVFLDDDVRLREGFFVHVESCLTRHPAVRAFGGRVIPGWGTLSRPEWLGPQGDHTLTRGPLIDQDFGDDEGAFGEGKRFAFVSACCFVYRDLLEEMGGFRSDLGPNGGNLLLLDDTDLCHRIRAGGNTVLYVPTVTVVHPVAPGRLTKNYFRRWYTGHGRSVVRASGDHTSRRLAGVPRYLFRQWLQARLQSLMHAALGRSFRSFHEELVSYHLRGMITEYRHAHRKANGAATDPRGFLRASPGASLSRR